MVTPETTDLVSIGQSVRLSVLVLDGGGQEVAESPVTWRSSDVSVATVSRDGLVTAYGEGSVAITAMAGQKTVSAWVTVSNPEYAPLWELYETTGGEHWKNSMNWLSDEPVSNWYGVFNNDKNLAFVQQSNSNAGLERLDLSNNQLAGEIPSGLGNLDDLRYLDLSKNALTGEIPATLGKLSKLDTLKLNNNLLSGELPTELGNLSNLQALSLHDNTDLTGPLPQSFTNLDILNTLSLTGTLLCTPIDTPFQNWLDGIENKNGVVSCGDDTILDRSVLIALYNATDGINWKTSTNWLTDVPLDSWHGVGVNTDGRVDSLILKENDLSGTITTSLGNLEDLQVLDLSNNELSGVIPSELGKLARLVTLDLSNNELSGEIPFTVISLPSLQTLDLSGNQFASLPTERDALIALYNATGGPDWYASTNWLSDQPIGLWDGVTTNQDGTLVTGLELRYKNLAGGLPPELGLLTGLTSLDLSHNSLSGELPSELGRLTSLTSLDLSWNDLSGRIPSELGRLTSLTSLDLSWNDLSGRIPLEMTQLVNLTRLFLQQTSICVPKTEEFRAWISEIGSSRVTSCVGGTPGSAPVDQAAFDALFSAKILTAESFYLEFDSSGRFTEAGEFEGNYTYTVGDFDSGTGVLTLDYDEGESTDSCTVELVFIQPAKGNTRYRCDDGLFQMSEQWKLSDTPDPGNFNIEIIWVGQVPSESYKTVFDVAVERWESIITSDLADEYLYWFELPTDADQLDDLFDNGSEEKIYGYVDDLRIYVQMTSIDGPEGTLGYAGPVLYKSPTYLPRVSAMVLDTDDFADFTTVGFHDLVLHELAHTLGFGTVWDHLDLVENASLDLSQNPIVPAPDTHFSGLKAISAFNSVGGSSYTGAKVPVENAEGGAGSQDGHWRNSVIGPNELMDGFGDPSQTTQDPLSMITIESMADLGYTVDVTQADSYTLPSDDGLPEYAKRPETQIPLNCFTSHRFQSRMILHNKLAVPLFERTVITTK